jgi:hypothetical protein
MATPSELDLLLERIQDYIRTISQPMGAAFYEALRQDTISAYTNRVNEDGSVTSAEEARAIADLFVTDEQNMRAKLARATVSLSDVKMYVTEKMNEFVSLWIDGAGRAPTENEKRVAYNYIIQGTMEPPETRMSNMYVLGGRTDTHISPQFQNILEQVVFDGDEEIKRWPDAFTIDKKLGKITRQAEQVKLIAGWQVNNDPEVRENILRNWDQWEAAIEELSTEKEHDYDSAADKVFDVVVEPADTPAKQRLKARFVGWGNIGQPNMPSLDDATAEFEYAGETEQKISSLSTDALKTFENEMKAAFPDVLLQDAEGNKSPVQITERDIIIAEGKQRLQANLDTLQGQRFSNLTIAMANRAIMDEIRGTVPERLAAAQGKSDLAEQISDYVDDPGGLFEEKLKLKFPDINLNAEAIKERTRIIANTKILLSETIDEIKQGGGTDEEIAIATQGIINQLIGRVEGDINTAQQIGVETKLQEERQTELEKVDTETEAGNAVDKFLATYFGVGTKIPDYARNEMAKGLLDSYTRAGLTDGPIPDNTEVLSPFAAFVPNWIAREQTDPEQVARGILGMTDFSKMALDKEVADRLEASVSMLSEGIQAGLASNPFSGQLAGDVGAGFMQNIGLTPMGGLAPLPGVTGMMAPLPRDTDPSLTSGGMDIYKPSLESFTQQPAPFGDYPSAVQALAGFDPVEALRQQYDPSKPPTPPPGFFTAGGGLEPIGGRGVIPMRDYAGELGPVLQEIFAGESPEYQQFISQGPLLTNLLEQFRKSQQIPTGGGGVMGAVMAAERAAAEAEGVPAYRYMPQEGGGFEREFLDIQKQPVRYGAASAAWGDLRRAQLPTVGEFVEKQLPGLRTRYEASPFYGQEQTRLTQEREYEGAIAEREAAIAESARRGELRGGTSIFRRRTA